MLTLRGINLGTGTALYLGMKFGVSVNATLKVINDLLLCNGMVALKGLSNTTRHDG